MKDFLSVTLAVAASIASAGTDISLPAPRKTGGAPLLEVLAQRKSVRAFDAAKELSPETLSTLLWAANGVARDADHRTAPSALNLRDTVIYVVLPAAVYRYDAPGNKLVFVKEGDFRAASGMQPFVATAPVNLVYAADQEALGRLDAASREKYGTTDVAFVSENVYLFCASEGLATVVRGAIDGDAFAKAVGLPETHRVVLAQTVGYPAP